MHWIVEPGFFANDTVRVALEVGVVVAIAAACVGTFVVLRGQSFAGHALTDVATAGGAGAFLVGWSSLAGFLAGGLLGAGAMDAIGVNRLRGRDIATGIVLGAATGLAALFFYLTSTTTSSTGASTQVLFGSLFSFPAASVPIVVALSVVVVAVVGCCARPLLISSLSGELAAARGVRLQWVGWWFTASLALSVALSAVVLGSILSTALLIGPPAIALRLSSRLGSAVVVAALVGVGATVLGILLAYDSYYWSSSHRALPVSFFVVANIVVAYAASSLWRRRARISVAGV